MAVIIKAECQNCEAAHQAEFQGVIVAGFQEKDGEMGIAFWNHDLALAAAIEVLSTVLNELSQQVAELEKGKPEET